MPQESRDAGDSNERAYEPPAIAALGSTADLTAGTQDRISVIDTGDS